MVLENANDREMRYYKLELVDVGIPRRISVHGF